MPTMTGDQAMGSCGCKPRDAIKCPLYLDMWPSLPMGCDQFGSAQRRARHNGTAVAMSIKKTGVGCRSPQEPQVTTRQANLAKMTRPCLKCGRTIRTDRCHRICVACSHRNDAVLDRGGRVPYELRRFVRCVLATDCSGGADTALAPLGGISGD